MEEKTSQNLNKHPGAAYHQGMTVKREERMAAVAARRQQDIVVVLENVHDPHNIGAVLRTCDSVGVYEVFILYTENRLTEETLNKGLESRTSSGAYKWVKTTLFTSVDTCIAALRERKLKLLGTHLHQDAVSIYHTDFTEGIALVLGNEKDGLSLEMLSHLDGNIFIPQVGMVKSLNISVACAVVLYELYRQRELAGKYTGDITNEEILNQYKDSHRKLN